ncbi:hypothetical protein AB0D67_38285 [Streptosporangium sp. NPDC048047]|uniref:hypothetical protein n=1 Tax=Streptosporangium sp. NPDC048047 TaxID=3155748 RepID=UPI00341AF516
MPDHLSENCCVEPCPICGAAASEKCRDALHGDLDDEVEPRDTGDVVDGFGTVVSDAETEAPPW